MGYAPREAGHGWRGGLTVHSVRHYARRSRNLNLNLNLNLFLGASAATKRGREGHGTWPRLRVCRRRKGIFCGNALANLRICSDGRARYARTCLRTSIVSCASKPRACFFSFVSLFAILDTDTPASGMSRRTEGRGRSCRRR